MTGAVAYAEEDDEPELVWVTEDEAEPADSGPRTLRDRLDELPFELRGYAEARYGLRTQDDPGRSDDDAMAEIRLDVELAKGFGDFEARVKADILYDEIPGEGDIDLREASLQWTPSPWFGLKAGRQILTWGVGDLLFVNDLFPKDWVSFLIGREVSYLKAPSDALKTTFSFRGGQLALVYTPRFDPDRHLTGERVSFWDPSIGGFRSEGNPIATVEPDDWASDDEWAARLQVLRGGWELAVYGYDGFWKSPAGLDPTSGRFAFPHLRVWGASAQGTVLSGIGAIELGWYDSTDDPNGDNPLVDNSEVRALLAWSRDLGGDLSLGVQYYHEHVLDHDALAGSLPPAAPIPDEDHQLLTLRLTKMTLNQNLTFSLFAFYSPSDEDHYLRPRVSYRLKDQWTLDLGANLFGGRHRDHVLGTVRAQLQRLPGGEMELLIPHPSRAPWSRKP